MLYFADLNVTTRIARWNLSSSAMVGQADSSWMSKYWPIVTSFHIRWNSRLVPAMTVGEDT